MCSVFGNHYSNNFKFENSLYCSSRVKIESLALFLKNYSVFSLHIPHSNGNNRGLQAVWSSLLHSCGPSCILSPSVCQYSEEFSIIQRLAYSIFTYLYLHPLLCKRLNYLTQMENKTRHSTYSQGPYFKQFTIHKI